MVVVRVRDVALLASRSCLPARSAPGVQASHSPPHPTSTQPSSKNLAPPAPRSSPSLITHHLTAPSATRPRHPRPPTTSDHRPPTETPNRIPKNKNNAQHQQTTKATMGSCCSCFDAIRGGKHGNSTDGNDKSTEMTSRNSATGVPPPTHGMSMAMSAPTIRIQGFKVCFSWCLMDMISLLMSCFVL
jgi:hypothetical protein